MCKESNSLIIFFLRCEPFSTYPRSYDLLHANHLFSHNINHEEGCLLEDIMLEMDRIIRPQASNFESLDSPFSLDVRRKKWNFELHIILYHQLMCMLLYIDCRFIHMINLLIIGLLNPEYTHSEKFT